MCSRHYQQWKKSVPVDQRPAAPRSTLTDGERFRSFVNQAGPIAKNNPALGPCHLWTGGKDAKGYGIAWITGRTRRAHIVAYEWARGPVPNGLVLDHFACDRTSCVNPEHVRPTSQWENVLRSGTAVAAINAAKTVCDHGHDYTEANTYFDRHGSRQCRECRRINDREAKRRQREAAKAAGLSVRDYLAQQRPSKAAAAES
jgi:hypothetical protein